MKNFDVYKFCSSWITYRLLRLHLSSHWSVLSTISTFLRLSHRLCMRISGRFDSVDADSTHCYIKRQNVNTIVQVLFDKTFKSFENSLYILSLLQQLQTWLGRQCCFILISCDSWVTKIHWVWSSLPIRMNIYYIHLVHSILMSAVVLDVLKSSLRAFRSSELRPASSVRTMWKVNHSGVKLPRFLSSATCENLQGGGFGCES